VVDFCRQLRDALARGLADGVVVGVRAPDGQQHQLIGVSVMDSKLRKNSNENTKIVETLFF
jgi:hypothetical protein